MSTIAFQPLEMLDKKRIPTTFTNVQIKYGEQNEVNKDITEVEQTGPRVQIIDKRGPSMINRDDILARLRGTMRVINEHTQKKDDIANTLREPVPIPVPVCTGRRLVIRDPETVLTPSDIPDLIQEDNGEVEVDETTGFEDNNEEEQVEQIADEEVDLEKNNQDLEELLIPDVVKDQPKKARKPRAKKGEQQVEQIADIDLTTAMIRSQKVFDRLPKERERILIKAPSYYMNNRKIFTQKLTELFKPYQKEIAANADNVSCDTRSSTDEFDLLTHQKIVRDYLNLYTPYRGLLLYHGLGSGKTCTSIAIAEGMKSDKRVFVMTPASLKMNFFSEMKKCGDDLYKKNQHWEYISIDGNPDYVGILSRSLSLSTEYVRNQGGAWLVNITKDANFTELSSEQQFQIDAQLNEMIRSKYTDINYNGMNMRKMQTLTGDFSRNPFDNAVVIIDEAHNFVSRIVNKIKSPKSISYMLYNYLMSAKNAKIVLLSGTPIINYPNEIGILYNILRGHIKTWTLPIKWEKSGTLKTDTILSMLDDANLKTFDYVDYADNKLTITRNPFGFVNTKKRGVLPGTRKNQVKRGGGTRKSRGQIAEKMSFQEEFIEPGARVGDKAIYTDDRLYKGGAIDVFDRYNGVHLDDTGNITDEQFIERVIRILQSAKNGITVNEKSMVVQNYKALPDESDSFLSMFVDADSGNAINMNLFQRRILGLTSYFRSAQEQLLPRFEETAGGDTYHVVKTEMSDHQFGIYEKVRKEEADREKRAKKMNRKKANDELFTISSTYRIFSRAACNFTFPEGIDRPVPIIKEDTDVNEDTFDAIEVDPDQELDDNTENKKTDVQSYSTRIENALNALNENIEDTSVSRYLSKDALPTYSPKFAKILENITDPANRGLHLMYSHFRTIEGIGVMRLILLANGFAEFKLQKVDNKWTIIEREEDAGKPRFVLYTGTETTEEKEIIRNVYNGAWEFVPQSIVEQLQKVSENNHYGEVIKVFMITSSGAEGINLKNTRYVHIVEPYWHMVRVEQVVGRARRICSHQDLPDELRTVRVFLYASVFSEQQKTSEKNIELRIRDVSRMDKKTPVSTDETLYEIASMKQRINNQILRSVKESAIDCNIFSSQSSDKDPLVCYGHGRVETNQYSSYPMLEKDKEEKVGLDVKKINWKGVKVSIGGKDYVLNKKTNELYDYDSYLRAVKTGSEPTYEGRLIVENGKPRIGQ